jgi:sodium pump decarboxylase gamma subunit
MHIFIKSVELMVVGMGMTFAFLMLMVGVMGLLKVFVEAVNKRFPEYVPAAAAHSNHAAAGVNDKIAAAIAAAKHHGK